jgi:hypothetical protein
MEDSCLCCPTDVQGKRRFPGGYHWTFVLARQHELTDVESKALARVQLVCCLSTVSSLTELLETLALVDCIPAAVPASGLCAHCVPPLINVFSSTVIGSLLLIIMVGQGKGIVSPGQCRRTLC